MQIPLIIPVQRELMQIEMIAHYMITCMPQYNIIQQMCMLNYDIFFFLVLFAQV